MWLQCSMHQKFPPWASDGISSAFSSTHAAALLALLLHTYTSKGSFNAEGFVLLLSTFTAFWSPALWSLQNLWMMSKCLLFMFKTVTFCDHLVCVLAVTGAPSVIYLWCSWLLSYFSCDCRCYSNAYYAKIGGVSLSELNTLEIEFLLSLDFKLHVTIDMFGKYCRQLEVLSTAWGWRCWREPN